MTTSLSQHHVTGFEIDARLNAVRITVNVFNPHHAGAKTTWIPGQLEIDLYPQSSHDPLAPSKLELLKQLSEAATAAYAAEADRLASRASENLVEGEYIADLDPVNREARS